MLAFLAARAVPATEQVAVDSYRRGMSLSLPGGEAIGTVTVTNQPQRRALRVVLSPGLDGAAALVRVRIGRLFDVACDPQVVAAALHDLDDFEIGLRLPGSVDAFEIAVRAVLGQQVTVAAARTLATRLVARFGAPLPPGTQAGTDAAGPTHVFPAAARLAVADAASLGELGIIRARGEAIITIAQALCSGELRLAPGDAVEPVLASLLVIRGIGPWTAHYIAMRTLGWTDAFPPGDVVVLKAMQAMGRIPRPSAGAVRLKARADAAAVAERWRPWRAYAVLHLWRRMAITVN
jgi:AraC family transcriptional regulator of adaptative response / DNA-3-methyladenine glycosylase II